MLAFAPHQHIHSAPIRLGHVHHANLVTNGQTSRLIHKGTLLSYDDAAIFMLVGDGLQQATSD